MQHKTTFICLHTHTLKFQLETTYQVNVMLKVNMRRFHLLRSGEGAINCSRPKTKQHVLLPSIPLPTRQSDTRLSLLDNIYCNNIASAATSGIIHDDLSDISQFTLALNIETKKILTEKGSVTTFNYRRVENLQVHLKNEPTWLFTCIRSKYCM